MMNPLCSSSWTFFKRLDVSLWSNICTSQCYKDNQMVFWNHTFEDPRDWGGLGTLKGDVLLPCFYTLHLLLFYITYVLVFLTWRSVLHVTVGRGQKRDDWEVGRLEGFSLCTNFFFPSLLSLIFCLAHESSVQALNSHWRLFSCVPLEALFHHVYFPVYTAWKSTQLRDFSW